MLSRRRFGFLLGALLAAAVASNASAAGAGKQDLLIFGAASLTDVLQEIGAAYTRETGQPVKFSFAASSALARQIEAGGRVDVFVSADLEWMDYLQARNLIDAATRRNVVGNRLVLIAPRSSTIEIKLQPNVRLAAALKGGRLATGDPDIVPVGRYARSALTSLGVWNEIADRLVRADNVRSALAFVARGETPLGIVYETDAAVDARVRIVDIFPADSHPPITYPVAATTKARDGARQFIDYLFGAASQASFKKFGFQPLARQPHEQP
jgi:molybdate transport system substrate-binding protein